MGDPKTIQKSYKTPGHPYQRERLETELQLIGMYGLRNKKELWRARTLLGDLRKRARLIRPLTQEQREKPERELIGRCIRSGFLPEGANLDSVLKMDITRILGRRLQTLVLDKGYAKTIHQSRQYIVHGHILFEGRRVRSPGMLIQSGKDEYLEYNSRSPVANEEHPMRKSEAKPKKRKDRKRPPQRGRDSRRRKPPPSSNNTKEKKDTADSSEKKG